MVRSGRAELQSTEFGTCFLTGLCSINEAQKDENQVKQNEAKLAKVLDVYENRLVESSFLAGDEFALADLSHLPNTQYLVSETDRGEMFMSRKNIGRWWGEISNRESWKKVVEMQN